MLRRLLVARKKNLTGVSNGLTHRSKKLDPTGNPTGWSTGPVSISVINHNKVVKKKKKNNNNTHTVCEMLKGLGKSPFRFARFLSPYLIGFCDVQSVYFFYFLTPLYTRSLIVNRQMNPRISRHYRSRITA